MPPQVLRSSVCCQLQQTAALYSVWGCWWLLKNFCPSLSADWCREVARWSVRPDLPDDGVLFPLLILPFTPQRCAVQQAYLWRPFLSLPSPHDHSHLHQLIQLQWYACPTCNWLKPLSASHTDTVPGCHILLHPLALSPLPSHINLNICCQLPDWGS